MERKKVISSNISSIGYNPEDRIIEIEFHDGGIYQYFDVPKTICDDLMTARSHGSFFHRYIKNNYQWRKIQ